MEKVIYGKATKEIVTSGRKKEYADPREKLVMKKFPVTKKEMTGCVTEKMTNEANRAALRKFLKNLGDTEIEIAVKNYIPKY